MSAAAAKPIAPANAQAGPQPVEDRAPICGEDAWPHISAGDYQATCVAAHVYAHPIFAREVIQLTMRILDGQHQGVELPRFYPGRPLVGRDAKRTIGPRSTYFREWVLATQGAPQRGDRLSPRRFYGKRFLVQVVTVERGQDQRALSAHSRYSKVSAILELLTTNEPVKPAQLLPSALPSDNIPNALGAAYPGVGGGDGVGRGFLDLPSPKDSGLLVQPSTQSGAGLVETSTPPTGKCSHCKGEGFTIQHGAPDLCRPCLGRGKVKA